MIKNPPANAGDASSIPGSGRSPRGGNGNPLQDSSPENPMERGFQIVGYNRVTERTYMLLLSFKYILLTYSQETPHSFIHSVHLGTGARIPYIRLSFNPASPPADTFYLTCKLFFVFLIDGHCFKTMRFHMKICSLTATIEKASALEAQACIPT